MRVFGGAFSPAVFGLAVGLAMAGTAAWGQESEATAEPIVIEIIGDVSDADTTTPAADAREKTPEEPATGDPSNLTPLDGPPLASTASTGGSGGATGAGAATSQEKIDPFIGSFSTAVPIQVPPFHGIAPNLALTYNSSRGNGFVGVGWELSGLSVIERASPGKGAPRHDATDIFLLDGQELIECMTGTVSPSCDTGGTHATKIESYLRIKQDTVANTWEITGRDGSKTTYTAIMVPNTSVAVDTYRWAMASVADTHGNTVTYNWWCDGSNDCYPDTIAYNGNTVRFYREPHPDKITFATGVELRVTQHRLMTIDIDASGSRVRAFKIMYAASGSTNRSTLSSITQFSRDATLDVDGAITGGTSLPQTQFSFREGADGSFSSTRSADFSPTPAVMDQMQLADITGDGIADVCFFRGSGGTSFICYPALGDGSFSSTRSADFAPTNAAMSQMQLADINGDGVADVCFFSGIDNSSFMCYVALGDGSFSPTRSADFSPTPAVMDQMQLADITGDGIADVCFFWGSGGTSFICHPATGPKPDLLNAIQNSLGGTTTVDYTPSSAWTNQNLPLVLQTVSSITSDDGRGNTSTTSYAYEDGLWDAQERRFLGFRKATVTLPCIAGEAACPYSESTFRQDLASAGRVEQIDRFDGAGTLLTRALEEYVVNDTVAPYTALNTASESQIIVGAVTRRTRVTRSFDAYANVVEETGHGDADILGDEITAATDYAPNTTDYIVGLPSRMRSFEGIGTTGTLLTESQVHYDGATSWMTPPVRGDPTEGREWLDTEARFVASQAEYDTYGNVTATIDPLGRRSEVDYDSVYHLYPIAARNSLYFPPASDTRHQTSTLWDTVCGVPTVTTDLNGNVTTTTYDALCRPTRTDLPDGGFAITSYNAIGDPAAQYVETQTPPADGSGNIWSRTYLDGFGRPYRSTAKGPAVGQEILADTVYNDRGGVASQTAPYYTGDPVYTTTLDYDALDRPTGATHPDGNWTETAYGAEGVFLSTTGHDELGHPVTLHLDAFGRAVRKTEPLDLTTTITTDYAYDRLGRLTGITDDAGNDWAYSFDSFGRTLTIDDPDLGLWSKSYDDAGQLLTQTDALAQVTRFTYDLLGRMLTKTARDGTPQAELTSYTYDQAVAGFHNVGLLTRAQNPTGTLNYRYDQMGRETQRIYTLDGTDYTIASGFDIAGRLLWQDYPDGDAVGSALDPITYDAAGRLSAIPGLVTAATYDARGNAETYTRANGVVSTYGTSDQRGWLDSLTTLSGATSIQALTYTRDATGQITAVASTHADESWTYGYDALRRLLSATNTNTAAYNRTYTYDSIGNMLSNSGIVGSYSYPTPTSSRPHAVTAIGGWTYSYDANGNMTAGAGRTFTYNGDNRPTTIDTQAYSYGPDGERWKTVDTAPGGGTTLYLGGTIEIAAGVMTKYLPGNAKRVGSPGDLLVETFWLHRNRQGSIQSITDAIGAEVQRFQYYPYGDRIATATAHDESKGWIGERQDSTGLFYLHARYYDPVIGRFNSADPSDPLAPGVGLNRYAYAFNTPIMRVDPWGLNSREEIDREVDRERQRRDDRWDSGRPGRAEARDERDRRSMAQHGVPFSALRGQRARRQIIDVVMNGGVTADNASRPEELAAAPIVLVPLITYGPVIVDTLIIAGATVLTVIVGDAVIDQVLDEQAPPDGDAQAHSDAGLEPDQGGRTAAGRAAEKHGSRPGSAYPPTSGPPEQINQQGQDILDDMVTDPGSTVEVDERGRTTITAPDGRAVRYNPDGSLQGFREPEANR